MHLIRIFGLFQCTYPIGKKANFRTILSHKYNHVSSEELENTPSSPVQIKHRELSPNKQSSILVHPDCTSVPTAGLICQTPCVVSQAGNTQTQTTFSQAQTMQSLCQSSATTTTTTPSLSSIIGNSDHVGFDSGFLDFLDLDSLASDEQTIASLASSIADEVEVGIDYDQVSVGSADSEIPISSTQSSTALTPSQIYPIWKNKDALCWLDVALCLLVHSKHIQTVALKLAETCIIRTLMATYSRAICVLNQVNSGKPISLETSVGTVNVRTGGGEIAAGPHSNTFNIGKLDANKTEDLPLLNDDSSMLDCLMESFGLTNHHQCRPPDVKASDQQQSTQIVTAQSLLDQVREQVWSDLQPKLKCSRGRNDSPVFALPLLLKSPLVADVCNVDYTWRMVCCHCGYQHEDR